MGPMGLVTVIAILCVFGSPVADREREEEVSDGLGR